MPALKGFYETNKDHFVWVESADVILVNAKYFAYAPTKSINNEKDTGQSPAPIGLIFFRK